jgi:hypothetical protein
MKLQALSFFSFIAITFYQCDTHSHKTTRVALNVPAAAGVKIYLTKIPYTDEKAQVVDSAIAKNSKDSVIFIIPTEEDRSYEIRIKNTPARIYFIADAAYIHIRINNFNGKSEIAGSAATISLRDFNQRQNEIMMHARGIHIVVDSLIKNDHANKIYIRTLQKQFDDSIALIKERNVQYADTVKNPAAFLSVYSSIDFDDNDRQDLKQLILRAGNRFPGSQPVQKLKQEVLDMISIFEEEFNIGDSLPVIKLPDLNGNIFSTASLKGKYYLIDFWSTWCRGCVVYDQYKKKVKEKISPAKFEMVSVALDDDKKTWSEMITKTGHNWPQLIDEKMWRGTAAKTLKFDSIPFNFLVSPEGRIIAKAIKADSLIKVLERVIK